MPTSSLEGGKGKNKTSNMKNILMIWFRIGQVSILATIAFMIVCLINPSIQNLSTLLIVWVLAVACYYITRNIHNTP